MVIHISTDKCKNCHTCKDVLCPAGGVKKAWVKNDCFNCGACVIACPFQAIEFDDYPTDSLVNINNRKDISSSETEINDLRITEKTEKINFSVKVNGKDITSRGMVKDALEVAGVKITKFFESHDCFSGGKNSDNILKPEESLFVPCECGGCWACVVKVNGQMAISCITPLTPNIEINTLNEVKMPLRVVSGFGVHTVGGVGTPYPLKKDPRPSEVVGFTHGCNLRCPQCQNNRVAFTASGNLLEPEETVQILLGLKDMHEVNIITLSGGESTLNRPWLLKILKLIRAYDKSVNIHIDTNGSILTPEYIDELIFAGMTHIGIDLKGINLSTFQTITGIEDAYLASKYLENSWNAVEYLINNYKIVYASSMNYNKNFNINNDDNLEYNEHNLTKSKNNSKIFLGVGIPYNSSFISKKEIKEMGIKLSKIDREIQVCVLDYRPEFRRKDLMKPTTDEMIEIKSILNKQGLETVIIQTEDGNFGP